VLPTTDDAAATSAIALREGHSHGDLMAAQATATLTDGGTNTVTLGMTRRTMLIQSVVVKKVPTAATAVSVTIAPLWQSLCVGGTFSGEIIRNRYFYTRVCTILIRRKQDYLASWWSQRKIRKKLASILEFLRGIYLLSTFFV